jgi:radical SAM superfamily enzyme YgiQ (UPF0313 family)
MTLDYTTSKYFLNKSVKYPPLGLLTIAAHIDRNKHEVKVVDIISEGYSIDETIEIVHQNSPDVLGISAVSRRAWALKELLNKVNCTTVVGGPHTTYWSQEIISLGADYVIIGYGERPFPKLINDIENGIASESILTDWDNPPDFPFPDRTLINLKEYVPGEQSNTFKLPVGKLRTTMFSSRGCPFKCIFCDVQEKRYLPRSPKRVVEEMIILKEMGVDEIHIFEDCFNIKKQRVLDICNEIIKRKLDIKWSTRARIYPFDAEIADGMRNAGGYRINIGVESLDGNLLKYMNKKTTLKQIESFFAVCNEYKIETLAYFMIGFPGETEEYRTTLPKKIKDLGITFPFFNILYPLPCTKYYRDLIKQGIYKKDYWAEYFKDPTPNFELPLPRPTVLQDELYATVDEYIGHFYFSEKRGGQIGG